MNLFGISFPNKIKNTDQLYFDIQHGRFNPSDHSLTKGTILGTNTYFNIFSLHQYLKYTTLEQLILELSGNGAFHLKVIQQDIIHPENQTILYTDSCILSANHSFSIPICYQCDNKDSVLFFTLEALEDSCYFFGGFYKTEPAILPSVCKLAMVICTYNREEYVYSNLKTICSDIFDRPDSPIKDDLEIFIVDNGKSLQNQWGDHPQIHYYQNKNLGGSGGFTRGMLEVLQSQTQFSHILLCDDDITLDADVLVKNIQFLKIQKKEAKHIYLAGSMLYIDRPCTQHEAGARWDGINYKPIPVKPLLELNHPEDVLKNETEVSVDYAGWGYLCFPVSEINENNLPLPLFVKWDDTEFALRNHAQCITLNGIGFWHPSYQSNYSPTLTYYDIRNSFVINACLGIPNHFKKRKLTKFFFANLVYGNLAMVKCILWAINDYLYGIRFFQTTDGQKNHQKLQNMLKAIQTIPKHTKKEKMLCSFKSLFSLNFWHYTFYWFRLVIQFVFTHNKIDQQFKQQQLQICNIHFWKELLKED